MDGTIVLSRSTDLFATNTHMIQLQGRALGALEDVGAHGRVHHRRRQQRGVERKLVRQVLPHALVVNRVAEGEVVLAVLLRRHVVHDETQVQHAHHAQRNRHHHHHDGQQSRDEVVLQQQEQSGANGELTSDGDATNDNLLARVFPPQHGSQRERGAPQEQHRQTLEVRTCDSDYREQEEVPVIAQTHTVAHPGTVVVVLHNAATRLPTPHTPTNRKSDSAACVGAGSGSTVGRSNSCERVRRRELSGVRPCTAGEEYIPRGETPGRAPARR